MKHEMDIDQTVALTKAFDGATRPSLTIDLDKYQEFLDGSGMSDAEKEEFLTALWGIIVNFVDLGFGVHPLQEVCGKDSADHDALPQESSDVVGSNREQEAPSGAKDGRPRG